MSRFSIKRYDITADCHIGDIELDENKSGRFVEFRDHRDMLYSLERQLEEAMGIITQYVYFCEDLEKFSIKQPVRSETLHQFKTLMSSGVEFNKRHEKEIKKLRGEDNET